TRLSGGSPVNLTRGVSDSNGYWQPTWSPDGKYLALLSTRGGDNVRAWVREQGSGRLMKLSDRGIPARMSLTWIDNDHLLTVLLPEGERPSDLTAERKAAMAAMREWPKAWAGREPTESALESGVPVDVSSHPQQQLTLLDLAGHAVALASAASITDVQLAP